MLLLLLLLRHPLTSISKTVGSAQRCSVCGPLFVRGRDLGLDVGKVFYDIAVIKVVKQIDFTYKTPFELALKECKLLREGTTHDAGQFRLRNFVERKL